MKLTGTVSGLTARIPLTVILPHHEETLDFILDTGFLGGLALPETEIERLGLSLFGETEATLADGTTLVTYVYEARLRWGTDIMRVATLAMGEMPLIGTSLLEGCNVNLDFIENGNVTITLLKE
jgi:clan AA aspartic protease